MLEILPATIASTEYVSRYMVPMTCLFVPTFAGVLTKYLAELRLCPSFMTDNKMSGPSSNTTNKMFGPGNPSMGQGKEQLHLQVNRRNLMRPS